VLRYYQLKKISWNKIFLGNAETASAAVELVLDWIKEDDFGNTAINLYDKAGIPAIQYAVNRHHWEIVRKLWSAGAMGAFK